MATKKTITKTAKAKATLKIMTIREFFEYYKNLKASGYNPPLYQRETTLKCAESMMVSLLSYATHYEDGCAPLIDFIYIREIDNEDGSKTIEIVDGQHRSEVFSFILTDNVKVATKDVNKVLNKICQTFGGNTFSELDEEVQEAILDLKIPVQFVTCSDDVANALFQILNSGKPLNTNDKVRNNWYKNNMYQAVESAINRKEFDSFGMRKDSVRNMLYRCLAMHKDIGLKITGSASSLNDRVLEKTTGAKWTPDKCNSVLNGIIEVLIASNNIMNGRNQHEKMGLYIYLRSLSNTKATMKTLSTKKNKANFIDQYIIAKMEAESGIGGKPVTFHTDTAHNIAYSRAYVPVIKIAHANI